MPRDIFDVKPLQSTPLRLGAAPQRACFLVGIMALLLCAVGAGFNRDQFFRSYLLAFLFWLGISLGSAGVVMLHHLTGGGWGFILRRVLETSSFTIPLMGLLFLPLLLGLHNLYAWTQPAGMPLDDVLRWKRIYLNVPAFIGRAAFYFAVWSAMACLLIKWSSQLDRAADATLARRLRLLSGPGIAVYFFTMTFAAVDWMMSLEPHYYSTIFGALVVIGQILNTFAFSIVALILLADRGQLKGLITPKRLNDIGNLLLAFTMMWAYLDFAQYLITWSGNLTQEIPWYLHRTRGGWQWLAAVLVIFHFVIPFLLLLQRPIKRNLGALGLVAGWIMFMRWIDTIWMIVPPLVPGFQIHWMDVAASIGIGGIWIGTFLRQLNNWPLLPVHDYRLKEVLANE